MEGKTPKTAKRVVSRPLLRGIGRYLVRHREKRDDIFQAGQTLSWMVLWSIKWSITISPERILFSGASGKWELSRDAAECGGLHQGLYIAYETGRP